MAPWKELMGEQKSPGIIPLAVKDVFGFIQETPGQEFLLRVSYLEIYNEGTYVEGIKEEVVLSLIASGEEHRHVGSYNFNLLSSRSHTIFTLENMQKLKDEIREKKRQMRILEQRMIGSMETSPYGPSIVEMSQIKSAVNRVLQEQLREKTLEAAEMQETITVLRQQNSGADSITTRMNSSEYSVDNQNRRVYDLNSCDETSIDESTPTSVESLNSSIFDHRTAKECTCDAKSQLLAQAAEIELLKQD